MSILVFSDTHGENEAFIKIIQENKNVDTIFFLGDGILDIEEIIKKYPQIAFFSVRGNTDITSNAPFVGVVEIDNICFFYTHGHFYNVKSCLNSLLFAAKQVNANIVLFGHTHAPFYQFKDGLHLFNPGSLSFPKSKKPSYGLIELTSAAPNFSIIFYENIENRILA